MTHVYLVHGWSGSAKKSWMPWLKQTLEKGGYTVDLLDMPNPNNPKIEAWVEKLMDTVDVFPNEQTFLVGHSIGCQAILRYLERFGLGVKVKGVMLVEPWIRLDRRSLTTQEYAIAKPWLLTPLDFENIKSHSEYFIVFYSTNDPITSPDDVQMLKEKIDARLVNLGNRGHVDETSKTAMLPEIVDIFKKIEMN